MHRHINNKILLLLAILVALIVRFWRLSSLPFPPNGDEIAFGYYGWSLLHFGTDEYGKFLPINFLSIGDFKYPGLAYLNIIPAAIFGLSELTIRFWSAMSGVLIVPLVYLLSNFIFSNRKAALASALLVALSPWSILGSRLGFENNVALVITTAAIICLFVSMDLIKVDRRYGNKQFFKILAFLLFLVSTFTYGGQRIFIPCFIFALVAMSYFKDSELKSHRKSLLLFFTIITLVIAVSLIPAGSRGRSSEEIWKGPTSEELEHLNELYVGAGVSTIKIPPRLTWFFNNKYKITLTDFLDRYTDHFSPKFLFFSGESGPGEIPDMGVLLFIDLILLPVGLLTFVRHGINNRQYILLSWLLIAPIASALTNGGAHVHRASMMIVPLSLLSGYGFYVLTSLFKKGKLILTTFVILGIGYSSFYALNQIFIQKPVYRPWYKEQVAKQMTIEVLGLKDKYKAVAIGDDDYIQFLFYGKIPPAEFLRNSDITPLTKESIWERVNRLDNIHFKMPFECPKGGKLNVLYVCTGGNVPRNSKIVKTIYYLDGIPAYVLLEFYPLSQLPKELPQLPSRLHYMVDVETGLSFPDGIIPESSSSLW